jgi:hypothetical protein
VKTGSLISCCIALAASVPFLLASGGCAYHRACGEVHTIDCYAAWPCYGYHSTCWRPWPGECISCPSPFLPGEPPDEAPASELMPMPMPPVPSDPASPAAVPEATDPANPADPRDESASSRRRTPGVQVFNVQTTGLQIRESQSHESQAYKSQALNLESLRWAPTDSR